MSRLPRETTPAIYLAGFMGSGKNTVGERLAAHLGWTFIDLDRDIETSQGMTIPKIFDTRGEPEFRRLETAAIRACVHASESGPRCVVALGGGAFVQPGNFELIENHGVTIWLDCPLHRARARVSLAANRPLARDPQRFALLYEQRRSGYARAGFRIEITSDDPQDALNRILQLPIVLGD